ncbi:MAG: hypothetical protein WCS56_00290 [Bacilli bacterium]
MMTRKANDVYFGILCDLVGLHEPVKTSGYFELMYQLYRTEFVALVPNDGNRGLDGIRLRDKYGFPKVNTPCNLFEMFVALAIRCDEDILYSPENGDRHVDWFWMMMTNLGLNKFRDRSFGDAWEYADIEEVCEKFLSRDYGYDGIGGIFPLKNPKKDQRNVEIWYQLSSYLLEHPEIE